MLGDWDDIQVKLGLKSEEELKEQRAREREERLQRQEWDDNFIEDVEYTRTSSQISYKTSHKSAVATRKKARNKMAKQSRKKNRKR